ncbi:MAG: glycosyltransferase family 2 protein [Candidatus Eutrophobiaceae bacterium]
MNIILYSVVVPVFNSEKSLPELVEKTRAYLSSNNHRFELILVNDGSEDRSWEIARTLACKHEEVIAVDLLRNCGQHNAVMCGFRQAIGDYVITMDDDLQNPPEEIGKLISKAQEGHDLVVGRPKRKKHSMMRRIGSRLIGFVNKVAFNVKSGFFSGNFRVIHKDVVERICREKWTFPYIPGLVLKHSSRPCNILVDHKPRKFGKSNYSVVGLLRVAANLLFNHSTIPLRLCSLLGFCVAGMSFLFSLYVFVHILLEGSQIPGWASLAIIVSLLNGMILLLLSVIGEYTFRIIMEMGTLQSYEIKEIVRE